MSLLNQVLQDLQDRQAPEVNSAQTTLRDVRIPVRATARAQRPWVLWLAILILAGVSARLLWQRGQHNATAPAMAHSNPVPPAATRISAPAIAQEQAAATIPAPEPKPANPVAATPVSAVLAADHAPATAPVPRAQATVTPQAHATLDARTVAAAEMKKSAATITPPVAKPIATPRTEVVEKTARPLSPQQHAELSYQEALRMLQSGRPSVAEPQLRAALASDPAHLAARTALAGLLINGGRLPEATKVLAAGLALAPTYAPFAKLYARLRIDQGKLGEARAVLERAAPTAQDDPEYFALLAALYQRLGLYEQAAQTYRGALQAQPRNGVWWLGLGLALEGAGDRPNALQAYRRAQQSGTLDSDVLRYTETKITALQAGNGDRR